MSILDLSLARLDGTPATLGEITAGRTALLVNVASRCGLTPQYAGLEDLQAAYEDVGFTVVGLPCNQFAGQEPGTAADIAEFCSATYGVTFPMTEKIEVNGPGRHPLYELLTPAPNEDGVNGDVAWNFEKFLVGPDGEFLARFSPAVEPTDPRLVAAVEAGLPSAHAPGVGVGGGIGVGGRAAPAPRVPVVRPEPYEWRTSADGVFVSRGGNRVATIVGRRGADLAVRLEQGTEAQAQRLIAEELAAR